jgi:hypothetical protein
MRPIGAAFVAVVVLYCVDAALNNGKTFDGLVKMAYSIAHGRTLAQCRDRADRPVVTCLNDF